MFQGHATAKMILVGAAENLQPRTRLHGTSTSSVIKATVLVV
jgi:hypothetical protein